MSERNVCLKSYYKLGTTWSTPQVLNVALRDGVYSEDSVIESARRVYSIPSDITLEVQADDISEGSTVVICAVGFESGKHLNRTHAMPPPVNKDVGALNTNSNGPAGASTPLHEDSSEIQGQFGFLSIGIDLFSIHSVLGPYHSAKVLQEVMEGSDSMMITHPNMVVTKTMRDVAVKEQLDWSTGIASLVRWVGEEPTSPSMRNKKESNPHEVDHLDVAVESTLHKYTTEWVRQTPLGIIEIRPRILFHGPSKSGRTHMLRRVLNSVIIPHLRSSLTYVTTLCIVMDWATISPSESHDPSSSSVSTFTTFVRQVLKCLETHRPCLISHTLSLMKFFTELVIRKDGLPALGEDFVTHYPITATHVRLLGMQLQTLHLSGEIDEFWTVAGHIVPTLKQCFSFSHTIYMIDNAPDLTSNPTQFHIFHQLVMSQIEASRNDSCVLTSHAPLQLGNSGGQYTIVQVPMLTFLSTPFAQSLSNFRAGSEGDQHVDVEAFRCPGYVALGRSK